ncbi:MAG TPA: hypothetical protein VGD40_00450 [Chryseosolibacter sp.]
MTPAVIETIKTISILSVLGPLALYILKIKQLPRENQVVGVLVVISAITEVIIAVQVYANKVTATVTNLYFLCAFIVLCFYYYEVVFKFRSKLYFASGLTIYLLSFLLVVFIKGINVFHGELWALTGLILVIFGIMYNNYQVEKPPLLDKNLYSGLIFNAAIMFYFSFNFFLFLIANYVLTELSAEMARMAWAFHNVNNIIKNIAFAFGFYYTNRRRVNLTAEEVERIQWKNLR